jgi:hypothetical protein
MDHGQLEKFVGAFDWVLSEIKKVEIKKDTDQPGDHPEGAQPKGSE